ncbi:hypothetical protein AB0D67_38265 [Streptosporangium sp. NPDC048047]|uniref:hypothetical protein n=1 Tax=Streptosporangium sp. NPDC048047 TaxID=3155748 RepID=UPI003424157B
MRASSEAVFPYLPPEVALGIDLDKPAPLRHDIRRHSQAVKHLRFDHITERLTARTPRKGRGARLLQAGARTVGHRT